MKYGIREYRGGEELVRNRNERALGQLLRKYLETKLNNGSTDPIRKKKINEKNWD